MKTKTVETDSTGGKNGLTDGGLTVYRASAGSGKTYTLTLEFLKKALANGANPNKFREILAVTFTNKATEEMKSRIVDTLHGIAVGNEPAIAGALCDELGVDEATIADRAKKTLRAVLHNYSYFSVSTIDRFFQKILHAFLREAGLRPGFKLELDEERLMNEAVDRMTVNLQKNEFLYDRMMEIIDEQMETGRSWDVRKTIGEKGRAAIGEAFREFDEEFHAKICDAGFMRDYSDAVCAVVDSFERTMGEVAMEAIGRIEAENLQKSDFYYGKSGAVNFFYKTAEGNFEPPGARVYKVLDDGLWFAKSLPESVKNGLSQLKAALDKLIARAVETHENGYAEYRTALCVKKALNILGFLSEIETSIREIASAENLMPIGETVRMLGKLVSESDAPFIYEKTGTRYSTFMIDEFQDTSAVQWRNFKPLLKNSLAENNASLVVGDVKQSIYRWRNGDWRILAGGIFDDFRESVVSEKNLDTNWRSLPAVVEFNNALFAEFPRYVENGFLASVGNEEFAERISPAYRNAEQKIAARNGNGEGFVSVSIVGENGERTSREEILARLPGIVADLQDRGFRAGEIAVVVRTGADGQAIGDRLLEYKSAAGDEKHCFDILSQDSLFINTSRTVRFIVALLRAMVEPRNGINNAAINDFLHGNDPQFDRRNSGRLDRRVEQTLSGLISLSFPEIFEHIVNAFDLGANPDEVPYVQELHNAIISFSNNEISDVSAFLEYWDERGDRIKLSAGRAPDAINIITIHKSKGLEYPAVVVPFCGWGMKPRNETIWVTPETPPFDRLRHIPATYDGTMKDSLFAREYHYETMQALLDNLNLLYVAFTRAREELHVMLPLPAGGNVGKGSPTNTAVALSDFLLGNPNFMQGKMSSDTDGDVVSFTVGSKAPERAARKENAGGLSVTGYVSSIFDKKLRIRYDSENYSDEPQTPMQSRNYGSVMHKIFSTIATVEDLPAAIAAVEDEGLIAGDRMPELKAKIDRALNFAGEWFSVAGGYKVITERYLLLPAELNMGISRKPDRIMCSPNETVVVDYKFGSQKKDAHKIQVKNYMNLLKSMQYPNVKGFVWYVDLFEKQETVI